MRAAIYAVMTTLWCVANPVLARNGETGILIFLDTFEWVPDDGQSASTLLLCSSDIDNISTMLSNGYTTNIAVPGHGVYGVEVTAEGGFKIHQENIHIASQECAMAQPEHCQ